VAGAKKNFKTFITHLWCRASERRPDIRTDCTGVAADRDMLTPASVTDADMTRRHGNRPTP